MTATLQDSIFTSAPYATRLEETRGRLVAESPSVNRGEFQRDRDRILHSGAFRKMRNKTQVFIESEGDYYRTRLTHSLEVAQIARAIARSLGFNEDLTETIALAHDLGHPCFGHAGEAALSEVLAPYGGFNHNDQTFRVITKLERRYIDFDGLNLTWETLEGIAKHNGPVLPVPEGKVVPQTIIDFNEKMDLELQNFAGPEAQVAAMADEIAYNTHDIDDGYRAGFFNIDELKTLPLFGPIFEDVRRHHPDAEKNRVMYAVVRQVIGSMVTDLMDTTRANIAAILPKSAEDVRHAKQPIVAFSFGMQQHILTLRNFLRTRMYKHNRVNRACKKAEFLVKEMFEVFVDTPETLPGDWYEPLRGHEGDKAFVVRHVADYIAGMTDRYALQEHERLFSTGTLF